MSEKTNTKPPKGTRDFLPEDIRRREHVLGVIREVYERHGFEPIETPSFERLETLLGKYGEEGDQLVFKILHRGQPLVAGIKSAAELITREGGLVQGRSGETAPAAEPLLADMGLRYDLTVPLARVYAEYQGGKLPSVLKRYQIQPVWRADTPGKGRFREFFQCDVDVVGAGERVAEAEVAGAVAECMRRLGFTDFEIRVNHRALLSAFIEVAGIDPRLEGAAIVAVDKLDKTGIEGVKAELGEKGVGAAAQDKLCAFVLGEPDLPQVVRELGDHARGRAAAAELEQALALMGATPAAPFVRFNSSLARGLSYYTGAIFELVVKDLAGSLGGGGRYDGLIGMFLGRAVPACGFSLGLERILVVMEQRGMYPAESGRVHALLAATEPAALSRALSLAYQLRSEGLRIDLVPRPEKPGKVRKAADDRGLAHAVLVGAEEAVNLWSRAHPEVTDRRVAPAELAALLRGG